MMMNNVLSEITLFTDSSIKEAMLMLETFSHRIVFVINADQKLAGTITDGDIRRAILLNKPLETPVHLIMNRDPRFTTSDVEEDAAVSIMHEAGILHLPVLDDFGRLINMHSLERLTKLAQYDNLVVLMAGGEGKRLFPLTSDTPKPMIEVGGRPILETIIKSFREQGFSNFLVSLNYLGEKIKSYFGNGNSFGVNINYIEEKQKSGTAGCLRLIEGNLSKPFFVMNGDIMTKTNFKAALDFHDKSNSAATMFVNEYNIDVPFGVVDIKEEKILNIEEKPRKSFFVNAGIYILEPTCLDKIPNKGPFDMTNLFDKLIEHDYKISSFPIHEYWVDIGRIADLEKAQATFFEHFK